MKRKIMVVLVLALVALNAWGADYPTKPITVLQGFAPGGGSDVLAQATQPYLEKILGKSFVNQQNIRIDINSRCKGKSYKHSAGVLFYRLIHE